MHIHGRIEKGLISFLVKFILFQAVASIDLRWPKAILQLQYYCAQPPLRAFPHFNKINSIPFFQV